MYAKLVLLFLCSLGYSHGLQQSEITMFTNGVTVDSALNASFYLMASSGLPDHETQKVNPNDATDQSHKFWIAKNPAAAVNATCLPLGSIGMTISGVVLFNPLTDDGYNAVEGEHKETFDSCNGHPAQFGLYHYHQLPNCLYNGTADEFLGVAFDGYSIYGPNATDLGRLVTNADLDYCHGRNSTINGVTAYRYWITTQFPYILGCFKGEITKEAAIVYGIDSNMYCSTNATACNCPSRSLPSSAVNVAHDAWIVSAFLVLAVYVAFKA